MAIKKFKESDEDEQVRKTALREVRILKVRIAPKPPERGRSGGDLNRSGTWHSLAPHHWCQPLGMLPQFVVGPRCRCPAVCAAARGGTFPALCPLRNSEDWQGPSTSSGGNPSWRLHRSPLCMRRNGRPRPVIRPRAQKLPRIW